MKRLLPLAITAILLFQYCASKRESEEFPNHLKVSGKLENVSNNIIDFQLMGKDLKRVFDQEGGGKWTLRKQHYESYEDTMKFYLRVSGLDPAEPVFTINVVFPDSLQKEDAEQKFTLPEIHNGLSEVTSFIVLRDTAEIRIIREMNAQLDSSLIAKVPSHE
jgi:hypothetical protein